MAITNVCAVMPTFNQAEFLMPAIMSVLDQVDHLVVVNDGSTDHTKQELARLGSDILVLHQENQGTAIAINAGVNYLRREFKFDWLTWVSSDNVCYPEWIQTELNAVVCHDGDVGAVYSAMDVRVLEGMKAKHGDHVSFRPYARKWLHAAPAAYFGCSFIIREDVWPSHRGRMAHDYDHWMRVEEQCWLKNLAIIAISEPLAKYQVHPGQATLRSRSPAEKDARKWWREGLVRRKQMGLAP